VRGAKGCFLDDFGIVLVLVLVLSISVCFSLWREEKKEGGCL
jgi:hypothetical protein